MRLSFAGQIAPVNSRDLSPVVYALMVPADYAYEELRFLFEQRVGRIITREEFNTALRVDGLRSYSTDAPDAADRKRWQARQRATSGRLRERA